MHVTVILLLVAMKLDPHLLYCPLLLLIMADLATWIPVAGQSGNVPLGDNEIKAS